MRITIDIPDTDINRIAGQQGAYFVIREFMRDPKWFFENSQNIMVSGQQFTFGELEAAK